MNGFEKVAGAGGDLILLYDVAFGDWTQAEGGGNTVFTFTDVTFGVMARVTVTGVTGMVASDDFMIV